ncbi:hypothetical protein [Allokutzneria sp. NRRL B-24872]|uniref:hypothetical protein n=1 Tax=Allokutzneria sp. NRRL B-24872 TaxID=1137961 RepID=UPI000A3B60EA|nr:hypothetical protein [Allokutzneria sp. NRRL B-24872]
MTALERRYRRMLVVLPKWYRAEREEEMVAAFLDDADVRGEVSWPGEFGSLLALSARTRWPGTTGSPRALVKGQVVRLVALLGMLFLSVISVNFGLTSLFPKLSGHYEPRTVHVETAWQWYDFAWVGFWSLSLVTFLALISGARLVARVSAGLFLATTAFFVVDVVSGAEEMSAYTLVFCASSALYVACVFAGFHGDAPEVRARWWLATLVGVVAGQIGMTWLPSYGGVHIAIAAGAVVYVIGYHLKAWRMNAAWALASAVIVGLEAVEALSEAPAYLAGNVVPMLGTTVALVEAVALTVLALWLWAQAVKALPAQERSPLRGAAA